MAAVEISDAEPVGAPTSPVTEADWACAVDLVRSSQRILVASHKKPDGDAIGSLLGLGLTLERAGKSVTLACADAPQNSMAKLPGAERIVTDLAPHYDPAGAPAWDLIISTDASDLDRLGATYVRHQDLFTRIPVIDLDHHISNTRFGDANLVDPKAASATELVTLFLERLELAPTPEASKCLFFGLMTDTLSFQTESTSPRTFRVAARLLEHGAPLAALATEFRQRPLGNALVWSGAMGSLQFAAGRRIAWFEVPRSVVVSAGPGADTGGLSGFAGGIAGVAVGMVIEEGGDGNVYIGLRSAVVDVAAVAGQFGGGGHQRAAGCHFRPPATIADARAALLPALEAALPRMS